MSREHPVRSSLPLVLALAAWPVAVLGFSTTFFFPLGRGSFSAPYVIYVHGALFFAWLLLLTGQVLLIRARQVAWHRRIGWVGAALALGMAVSGVAVGVYAARRDLADTPETVVFGGFTNIVIEMLLFSALVAAAVRLRRDRASHQRLLLLATISVLGPAWFRWRHLVPSVPNPLVAFSLLADMVLVIPVVHDWRTAGHVHPVYKWVGSAMVATHMLELFVSESDVWVRTGRALLSAIPS